jgi:hypothetical protein
VNASVARLQNTTLRLDADLRQKAESSANEHNRNLAEELRHALQTYYKLEEGGVSLATLEERIRKHEQEYHGRQPPNLLESGYMVFETKQESEAKMECAPAGSDEERLDLTIEILQKLHDLLKDGFTPTPKELENALEGKISSRLIGRLLSKQGISAKNTRINDHSGRYFLPSMLPDISKKLDELK